MKIDPSKVREFVKARGLSNTQIAAGAGITRQALQTVLRQDHVAEVRQKTVKGLTRALRLSDASLLSPDPLVGYKDAVAVEHADLTFRGLGLPTTEPRTMDELHVPIRVARVPDGEYDRDCQPSMVESENRPIEGSDHLTVEQCLALHRRVLIRGEPGSGKTTALRHSARVSARESLPNAHGPKPAPVPLMVRLADFAKAYELDREMTLVRFAVTHSLRGASPDYWAEVEVNIQSELKRGSCLVLLDGLDEVGADGDLPIVLRRFIDEFRRNQFVLTSRIVGLDAGPWRKLGFATFEVARWRQDDIQEFARRWYAGRPAARGKQPKKQLDQRVDEFTAAILGHAPIREIASNPLMLTILAALHYANANLPRRRSELYAKIVEVMLETWEASKREARPGDPLHGIVLEAREFGWLLDRLALGMQREGRVLRPRWWVNDLVEQFLREQIALEGTLAREQVERVIRYLCERTGLLVERGDGVFGFCHRTFQEYFAARGLLLEAEGGSEVITLLRPYLFHPQWEEVIVHVTALLSALRATTLLRVILDDPDPTGRFLRRSQRLALRCLVDGAAVGDRALLDQIFSDGSTIGASKWLGIAVGFISLLKQLIATRHGAEAQRFLSEIDEGAREGLSEGDYATVYCFSRDLPDGPRNGAPGTVYRKRLGGRQVEFVFPAWEKRIEDPKSWFSEVLRLARNPKTEMKHRIVLISLLGAEVDENSKARSALESLLSLDTSPEVRAECAEALQDAASLPSVATLLLHRLNTDESDLVRRRCAEALCVVAPTQSRVRRRLEELFATGPELVRAGAARGLSRIDFTSVEQKALLDRLLATIVSPSEPPSVRHACIWAVASHVGREGIPRVNRVVETSLDDFNPTVSKAALHVLADAIAEGRREWSQPLVEKIETMLMAVTDPCPHLFNDLVSIAAMKEIHGGTRLERLLGDVLAPFGDQIVIAFVFGSVARLGQVKDSDVDLMIIGNVRLKEVAAAIRKPEQILGRPVNPVLFAPEKFREQYREGNPFLLDIVRKEKVFLKGSRNELNELAGEGSPD
jgi:predicted nucleotidyltransferase